MASLPIKKLFNHKVVKISLSEEGAYQNFKNNSLSMSVPFVLCADFECLSRRLCLNPGPAWPITRLSYLKEAQRYNRCKECNNQTTYNGLSEASMLVLNCGIKSSYLTIGCLTRSQCFSPCRSRRKCPEEIFENPRGIFKSSARTPTWRSRWPLPKMTR